MVRKGPDFVSRLRGYVNIKGPNRDEADPDGDAEFLIRRALLLRAQLQRHHKHLLKKQPAQISPGVISAFLRVAKYRHGARSLEAIVSMSPVGTDRFYGPAHMPPTHILDMHIEGNFMGLVGKGESSSDLLDKLARVLHAAYTESTGARPGDYDTLSSEEMDNNLGAARLTRAKLLDVGIRIEPRLASGPAQKFSFTESELDRLARVEHDRWLREKLLRGFAYAPESDKRLKLNLCAVPFDRVPAEMRRIDYDMTRALPVGLWELGYTLVRVKSLRPRSPALSEAPVEQPLETNRTRTVKAAARSAFISYRRDTSIEAARLIRERLRGLGYRVFLDVDDLGSHYFDERLLAAIERAPNFIVVLVPGSLNRCSDAEDWLRREIVHAIKTGRNIVPVLKDGFRFPRADGLPADMRDLLRHNGVVYDPVYFDAVLNKLIDFLCTEEELKQRQSKVQ
ncbi:MAG TPA: TIR domain-containing protein [bacterium]|nr:TIR domain-containing protein [bacterium]